MQYIGRIRDSLHGDIQFTAIEKIIIERPEFQRLRRIQQTSFMQYVFPCATHTRFAHSLGTMHLANKLYLALITNQKKILGAKQCAEALSHTNSGLKYLENSVYLLQCLRLAALLHDCGHSALSHSGEKFMPTWKMLQAQLSSLNVSTYLLTALNEKILKFPPDKKINHEVYTLILIDQIFQAEEKFLDKEMGQDICAILDLSIQAAPTKDLAKSAMQSLFHEVISGEVDVDRMDYLLRDSRECGVAYGYFDLERILDTLGFYYNANTTRYHLAVKLNGIPAYEDYLRARLSMYNQVYFHKTATACEAMLTNLKKRYPKLYLPIEFKAYISLDDHNIVNFLQGHSADDPLITELLCNRKLWKKVYEESEPLTKKKNIQAACIEVLNFLESLGIDAELIENRTNLTSFAPKASAKNNNFKVIVHNGQLQFLEELHLHSSIGQLRDGIKITRIFIPRLDKNNQVIDIDAIREAINLRVMI